MQSQANGQFAYWQGSYRWATGWDLSVTDYNGDQINDLLFYSPTTGAYFQAVTTGASIGDFTFTTGAALPAGVTLIGGGS